jgi:protein-disulfide isomerase
VLLCLTAVLDPKRTHQQESDMPHASVRRRASAWARRVPGLTLSLCSCAAPPASPPSSSPILGEIDLTHETSPADEAPLSTTNGPALKPCKADDTESCGLSTDPQRHTAPALDPEQRYSVPVFADDPLRGPANAPVTLVVYSDFQCPFCRQLKPVLEELIRRYPSRLRIAWKDHPLPMHATARPAAELGRAAYRSGGPELFWQLHDEMFDHQAELSELWLKDLAARHRLAYRKGQRDPAIARSLDQASSVGVRSTPTCFINGRPLTGARPLWMYVELIEQELQHSFANSEPAGLITASPPPGASSPAPTGRPLDGVPP